MIEKACSLGARETNTAEAGAPSARPVPDSIIIVVSFITTTITITIVIIISCACQAAVDLGQELLQKARCLPVRPIFSAETMIIRIMMIISIIVITCYYQYVFYYVSCLFCFI